VTGRNEQCHQRINAVILTSGVFRISVRRKRGAVGVDGVGRGGGGWATPQKKISFVPKMLTLGAF